MQIDHHHDHDRDHHDHGHDDIDDDRHHDHSHDREHDHGHGHGHDHTNDHGNDHGHGHAGCDSHSHEGWGKFAPHSHSVHTRLIADKRALIMCLIVQFLAFSLQICGAYFAASSLLAVEALHTFVDAVTILLSLISVIVATRSPNSRHTYGFGRAEILSAFLSLIALLLLCFKLFSSAVARIISVARGTPMQFVNGRVVVFAEAVTLIANVITAGILSTSTESLNMRAVRAHVIADSVENFVVLIAGVVLWLFPKWAILDPILSIFVIGLLVVLNWRLSVETIDVVMQAAPHGSVELICTRIEKMFPDVGIAEPHVWTLTTGVVVGSVKLFVRDDADTQYMESVRVGASKIMAEVGVNKTCVEVRVGMDTRISTNVDTVLIPLIAEGP